uniref:Interleukin-2 receptor subunit alpha n=1 Tax=Suricata suricatta TaxID=37032 RepID=A0A673UA21_SURSU
MEPSLLMWGIFTFIAAPGHMTEFCDDNPPDLKHATFKALTYKTGTMLNCECRRGFRRISNGSALMLCAGNASHSSWENKCQCISTSPRTTDGHITPKPEEQKGKKSMELQSQMQPMDQVNLPDDEESQAPTEAPPGSDTFCPSIPTNFQKHTEVARTAESFVFTTEYQIAVAGCVLLLVSVVLLSLLTWQRRRRKSRRTI